MTNSSHEDFVSWRDMIERVTQQVGERTVAKWLCEHASGCDAEEFAEVLDELVSERAGEHLRAMVDRLVKGEPLQSVMGRWSFRHLDLLIDERVLIPRPETEELTLKLANQISDKKLRILDLCSGSGCISIALSHHCKNIFCRGIDSNHRAVLLSLLNQRLNKISPDKITITQITKNRPNILQLPPS